ncbi:MAG TPA: YdcF family protein [Pirellulales bacterium]|nr:YdcF family protein [Pirellulales bacterium]
MTPQACLPRKWPRRGLGFLTVAACLAASLTLAWLGRAWLLSGAARWLNVGQSPQRCDYALVLPGGEETRPFAAAALVKAGLARQVLVPRTRSSPDVDEKIRRPTHEVIREVLLLEGVPSADIFFLGQDSVSTHTDALALADFLRTRDRTRVAVVTSNYHTRRTSWVLREVLGDRAADVRMVAVPVDGFDEDAWWQTREGTLAYSTEFAKLAVYAVGYRPVQTWFIGLALAGALAALLWRRRRARRRPADG